MTCVACSGAIERLMNNEFKKRGMVDLQIALLTHKMTVSFEQSFFTEKTLTTDMICDEVEMIGFGCELLTITEINLMTSSMKKRRQAENGLESESEANMSMSLGSVHGFDDLENSDALRTPRRGIEKGMDH
jgi:hypothetical protein